jgi:hypothetical protein
MKYATHDGYNITGHYEDTINTIIPDGAVPITDEQWKLSCAGLLRIENGTPVEYYQPGPTIEDRRISQRTELKKQREAFISSPVSGVQVRNSDDKENIKGAIDKWDVLGNPSSIPWIMEDNSVQLMSKQDLVNIENEYTLRKMQSFEIYRTLCAELCESDDPESITWPG